MMPSSPSSKIAASNIPTITALRENLDYGNASLDRCSAFYDDVRVFRKKYHTRQGLAGTSFHEWKSPLHQQALSEMTEHFLDNERNGPLYWPDGDTSPNTNALHYSVDEKKIKRLMKQLFFRLNQQQHRNEKYKRKNVPPATSPSPGGYGVIDPVLIDSSEHTSKSLPKSSLFASAETARAQSGVNCTAQEPSRDAARAKDVYEVLSSPEPRREAAPSKNTPRSQRYRNAAAETGNLASWCPKQQPPQGLKRSRDGSIISVLQTGDEATSATAPTALMSEARREACKEPSTSSSSIPDATGSSRLKFTKRHHAGPEHDSSREAQRDTTSPAFRSRGAAPDTSSMDERRLTAPHLPTPWSAWPTPVSDCDVRPGERMESEGAAAAAAPSIEKPAEPEPARARPAAAARAAAVSFVYRVVLSRSPVYESKKWTPRGKFQDKSMQQLLRELPLDGGAVEALVFNLEGPGIRVEERIGRDDELGFDAMKRLFNKLIGSGLAHLPDRGGPLCLDMEIEPVRSSGDVRTADLDDARFEW